jgi:hypothetical protein
MWGNDRRVLISMFSLFMGISVFQMVTAATNFHAHVCTSIIAFLFTSNSRIIEQMALADHFELFPPPFKGCAFHSTLKGGYILYVINICPDLSESDFLVSFPTLAQDCRFLVTFIMALIPTIRLCECLEIICCFLHRSAYTYVLKDRSYPRRLGGPSLVTQVYNEGEASFTRVFLTLH